MRNQSFIKSKLIFGALLCLAVQGCKQSEEATQTDTFSKSSIGDGAYQCTPSNSTITSALVVQSGSENSFIANHFACMSISPNLWIMNDGTRKIGNSLDHAFSRSGEYAAEALGYKNGFKVAESIQKIIVKSCDAGSDCKSIHSSDFANLNESLTLNFAEANLAASTSQIFNVKDADGNISELSSNSFSSDVAGTYEVSTESNGIIYKKMISVLDIPANQLGASACDLKSLMLSGPSESRLNESSYAKVNIPSCLNSLVSSIKWSFSDGQNNTYSQSSLFSFTQAGSQNYSVALSLNDGSDPIVLSRNILVSDEVCVDCPILAEDGSDPDRAPAGGGDGAVQGCGSLNHGQVVIVGQVVTSEILSCNDGLGSKVVSYTENQNQICSDGSMNSTDNSDRSILSEGACHSWIKTGSTECTAACGGTQNDEFSCLVNTGGDSAVITGDAVLCGASPSTEAYVCDGDPDFEEIKITEVLEKGDATVCHSNKTGYVIDKEITTETFHCVEHEITLVNTDVTTEEAPFCLDLKRCSNDSLSPSRAHGRLNWMNQCSSEQSKIQNFFDITADYESAPQNSYTVSADGRKIQGRPTYVTFRNEDGSVWKAPSPGVADYTTRSTAGTDATGISCNIPESADIAGICLSSCVTPSQIIASGNGAALPIKRAYGGMLGDVMTLSPLSTISKPVLMSTPVKQFITEIDDSEHDIMIFSLASGGSIEYTPNHPVVTADGNLKDAQDFVIGQSFVKKNGDLDEIVKIENIKYFGKVYNVYMQSSVLERNVVVINDYLTGSAYFQNEGHDFVDRQVLRSSLAK
jgi:hypothetical protein